MFAIYKKEIRSYFINPIGFVYIGIFLALSALLCCYTTVLSKSYSTASYFTMMIFAFIVLIPLLTMRLFSEEKKLRTEQLLLTAPVTITGMVLGKFFAALTVFASTLLVSSINFIPLYIVANAERAGVEYSSTHIGPATAEIIGGMIGILLIGAAFIAIGTFISSLTENQLAAAIVTMAVLLGMCVINILSSFVDVYAIRMIFSWFSVISRFADFGYGAFDFAALVYYVSLAAVFLFITIRVYDKRRWS